MTSFASLRLGLLAALLLLPGLAAAQTAPSQLPPLAPAAAQPAAPALSPATKAALEQRIAALKARLSITSAEEPAWNAFADTMRANTADTDALFSQRAGAARTAMTAPENMHAYAQIARTYADNTARLSAAFDTLYAGLTDTQKRAADTLFREQAAQEETPAPR
jgi:predicted outer membrane protein